jgi:hypothetical protein
MFFRKYKDFWLISLNLVDAKKTPLSEDNYDLIMSEGDSLVLSSLWNSYDALDLSQIAFFLRRLKSNKMGWADDVIVSISGEREDDFTINLEVGDNGKSAI